MEIVKLTICSNKKVAMLNNFIKELAKFTFAYPIYPDKIRQIAYVAIKLLLFLLNLIKSILLYYVKAIYLRYTIFS